MLADLVQYLDRRKKEEYVLIDDQFTYPVMSTGWRSKQFFASASSTRPENKRRHVRMKGEEKKRGYLQYF